MLPKQEKTLVLQLSSGSRFYSLELLSEQGSGKGVVQEVEKSTKGPSSETINSHGL